MATIMRLSSLITQTQSILQTNSEISRGEGPIDTLLKGFKGVTINSGTKENTNITDNVIRRDREMNENMNRADFEFNKEQEWNSTLQNECDANSFEKMTVPEFPFQIYSGNRPGQPIESPAIRQPSDSEQTASNLSLDNYNISDLHLRNERDHHGGSTFTLPSYNINDMHLRNERNDGDSDSRSLQNYNISELHTRQDRSGPHASRSSLQDYNIYDMHLRNERNDGDCDSRSLQNSNISELHTRQDRSGPHASRSSLQDYNIYDMHLRNERSKSHGDLKLNDGSGSTEIYTHKQTRQFAAPASLVRPRYQRDKVLQPIKEHSEYEPAHSTSRNGRMRENQHTYTYNNNTNSWTRIREFREGLRQVHSLSLWEKTELLKQGEIDETDLFNSEKEELGPSKLEHYLRQGRITNQFRNVRRVDTYDEPQQEHEITVHYLDQPKRGNLPDIPDELLFRLDRIRRNLSYVGLRTGEKELLFCHGHLEFNEFSRFDILNIIYREKERDSNLEVSEEDESVLQSLIKSHVERLSNTNSHDVNSPEFAAKNEERIPSKRRLTALADAPSLLNESPRIANNRAQEGLHSSNQHPAAGHTGDGRNVTDGVKSWYQQCMELCCAQSVNDRDTLLMHNIGLCCGKRRLAKGAQTCFVASKILLQIYNNKPHLTSLLDRHGWECILESNVDKEKTKEKLTRACQAFKRSYDLQQLVVKYSSHDCPACPKPHGNKIIPENVIPSARKEGNKRVKTPENEFQPKQEENRSNQQPFRTQPQGHEETPSTIPVIETGIDNSSIKDKTYLNFADGHRAASPTRCKLNDDHSSTRTERGIDQMKKVGLENPKNLCYMNSAIQMLRSVPDFRNAVLHAHVVIPELTDLGAIDVRSRASFLRTLHPEMRPVAEEEWAWLDYSIILTKLQDLYRVMDASDDNSSVNPLGLWNARASVVPRFYAGNQEDCSEYLENILRRLYVPFQTEAENGQVLTSDCPFQHFKSVSLNRNECQSCHTVSSTREFSAVTVLGINVGNNDIQSGLDSLYRTSLIPEYHCESTVCQKYAPLRYPMAKSSLCMQELPKYFFAKLKKFTCINGREVKIEINIACNKEISIPSYSESTNERKKARYVMVGVIWHSSFDKPELKGDNLSLVPVTTSSAFRGHYIYGHVEDNLRITDYNDKNVSEPYRMTESELSEDAYIVLYKLSAVEAEVASPAGETHNAGELTDDDLRRVEDESIHTFQPNGVTSSDSENNYGMWNSPNDNQEGKDAEEPSTGNYTELNVDGDNGIKEKEVYNMTNVEDGNAKPGGVEKCLQVPNGVLMVKETALTYEEVHTILKEALENPQRYHIWTTPPNNVKNGYVYLYKLQCDEDRDYLRDKVTRFHDKGGRETTKSEIVKKFFYLKVAKKPVPGVVKHVYSLKQDYKKKNSIVLIHYIGDNSYFVSLPHGNDKKGRNFVTPVQAVKDKIKKLVSGKGKPKDIYQDLTRKTREQLGDDFDSRGSVFAPRNTKQVKNFRAKYRQEQRLTKDEVFGLTVMSYLPAGNFLHEVHLKPLRIVVANPHVIEFAKNVLRESYREYNSLKQLISYDTTFQLADAYVSVLVMRNIYMQGDPIFPVAYLIHRTKHESGHKVFWDIITELLELQKYYSRIPIITDKEAGIRLAIGKSLKDVRLFLCHNHMIKDIERWLRNQGGLGSTINGICTQIRTLLDVDMEEKWQEFYEECCNKWSPGFVEYITRYKYNDLRFNSKFNYKDVPAFKDCLPTTNTSESENARMKRYFERQELLLDALALGLNELQSRCLFDFHLSFGNECGDQTPKSQYRTYYNRISLPGIEALDALKFSKLLKDQLSKDRILKNEGSKKLNCVSLGGALIARKGLVRFVQDMDCYLVKTYFSGTINIVKENKNKTIYECNCEAKGMCMHIYAVYEAIQKPIPEKSKRSWTLNVLKHIRTLSGRSGRKKEKKNVPRFGAGEYNIVEAPDSIDARSRETGVKLEFLDEEAEIEYLAGVIDFNGNPVLEPLTTDGADEYQDPEVTLIDLDDSSSDGHPNHSTPKANPARNKRKRMLSPASSLVVNASEWLNITHIETGIWTVIRNACAEAFVTSSPVEMCTYAKKKDYGRMIQIAARYKMLDRDIILQPMNDELDSNLKGGHWMLGGVLVQHNVVFLMDSLRTSVEDRLEHFQVLYRLAAAAAASGRLELNSHDWEFVYVSDCIQQENGNDCGIYTVMYANAIAWQQSLATISEIKDNREWFNNILLQRDSHVKRKPEWYPSVRIPQDCIGEYVKAMLISTPTTSPCYRSIAKELDLIKLRLQSNWSTCEAHICLVDETHSQVHNMCVGCRKWLHEDCEEVKRFAYPSLPDYTYCLSCWQWFDRVELGLGRLPSEIVPAVTGSDLNNVTGVAKGIEWETNSTSVDVAIVTLLHSSDSFDNELLKDSLSDKGVQIEFKTSLRTIVNTLRSKGFCSSATMFEFRKLFFKLWKKGYVPVFDEVIAGFQKFSGSINFYFENFGEGGLIFNTTRYSDAKETTVEELVLNKLTERNVELSVINTRLLIKMPWNSLEKCEYQHIIPNLEMNLNNLHLSLVGVILRNKNDYKAVYQCGKTWLIMNQKQDEELSIPEVQTITNFEKHIETALKNTLGRMPPLMKNILQNIYICVYKHDY